MKIIYDLGANNGDNLPYYFLKSDKVVAVEANIILCDQIKKKYEKEIKEGKLEVLNFVLSNKKNKDETSFYIHKNEHVWSQSLTPKIEKINEFEEVSVKNKYIIDLIQENGNPYYIKSDLELIDETVIRELFKNNIFPNYISAEAHNIEIFCLMNGLGNYNSFKIVEGYNVDKKYKLAKIKTEKQIVNYSFPYNSAGPFGNDIIGPWMNTNNFFKTLGFLGTGWIDIHCSKIDQPDDNYLPEREVKIKVKIQI